MSLVELGSVLVHGSGKPGSPTDDGLAHRSFDSESISGKRGRYSRYVPCKHVWIYSKDFSLSTDMPQCLTCITFVPTLY